MFDYQHRLAYQTVVIEIYYCLSERDVQIPPECLKKENMNKKIVAISVLFCSHFCRLFFSMFFNTNTHSDDNEALEITWFIERLHFFIYNTHWCDVTALSMVFRLVVLLSRMRSNVMVLWFWMLWCHSFVKWGRMLWCYAFECYGAIALWNEGECYGVFEFWMSWCHGVISHGFFLMWWELWCFKVANLTVP